MFVVNTKNYTEREKMLAAFHAYKLSLFAVKPL